MSLLTRRKFLGIAGITAAGCAAAPVLGSFKPNYDNEDFCFIHFTDVHIQPERNGKEGFLKAVDSMNQINPRADFAISGGDLIMDALNVSYERADTLYNMYMETSKKLKMPVYNVIGNHEHFGVYESSGVTPDHPEYGKKMFMSRLGDGRTYRSFDYAGWRFLLLDSVGITDDRKYYGVIDDKQLQWMEEKLESAQGMPVAIVMHIPFYSALPMYWYGPGKQVEKSWTITNAHQIAPMLEKYDIKLVLSGHIHARETWLYKGMDFTCGGAVCGAWWKGPYKGHPEGYGIIKVSKSGEFEYSFHTYGWKAKTDER